jgi:hypothetical protein
MRAASLTGAGESLMTALAGLNAYKNGQFALVLDMGAESPGAFAGAVALAAKLEAEVTRLGGDPAKILARVYAVASGLPPEQEQTGERP